MWKMILPLIILAGLITSCAPETAHVIDSGWSYSYTSDMDVCRSPDIDPSWPALDIVHRRPKKNDQQYLCLKKTITLPEHLSHQDLALYLGKVSSVDHVWLDSILIGKHGKEMPDYLPTWNYHRYYHLPIKENHTRTINLAIMVHSNYDPWLKNVPFIDELQKVRNYWRWKDFGDRHLPMATGIFTFILGMLAMSYFFFHITETLALHFSVMNLLWAALSMHFYLIDFGISFALKEKLYYTLMGVEMALIFTFMERVLDMYKRLTRIILSAMVITIVCIAFAGHSLNELLSPNDYLAISILAFLMQLGLGIIIIIAVLKKARYARLIFGGYLFFMAGIAHDALAISHIIYDDSYFLFISYPSLLLVFSIILLKEQQRTIRKAEQAEHFAAINTQLEHKSIELKQAYNTVTNTLSVINDDLTVARAIQKSILPDLSRLPEGITIDTMYQPLNQIGGDLYDISVLKDNTLRVFLADAVGHGIQAAMVTMIIHDVYTINKHTSDSPGILMETINHVFATLYQEMQIYFTGIVADISPDRKLLTYSSAGHHCQILVNNNTLSQVKARGRIVGISHESTYTETAWEIGPGSTLYLFSDGLFELPLSDGTVYSVDHMTDVIKEIMPSTTQNLVALLQKDYASLTGKKWKFIDDATALRIQID